MLANNIKYKSEEIVLSQGNSFEGGNRNLQSLLLSVLLSEISFRKSGFFWAK